MRGQFDNSVVWLSEMPPSVLSTDANADKFAEALEKRTGVPWVVKLMSIRRPSGGGFCIAPPPDRLVKDKIARRDWDHLQRLFGALETEACRWYLFPDEIALAFVELGMRIYCGVPVNPNEKKDSDDT